MARIRVIRESFVYVSVLFLNFIDHVLSEIVIDRNTPDLYDFDFFIRDDWQALPSLDMQLLQTPVSYVIIHHTPKAEPCYDFRSCKQAMLLIQRGHMSSELGDIRYNFCIGTEGGVYEGRGWDYKGAHAGPWNDYSIGICLIGYFQDQPPPQEQMDSLKSLIRTGVLMNKIRWNYQLLGHVQINDTGCPGDALLTELLNWSHFAQRGNEFVPYIRK